MIREDREEIVNSMSLQDAIQVFRDTNAYGTMDIAKTVILKALEQQPCDYYDAYNKTCRRSEVPKGARWISVSERLPEQGVAVLTYDGSCYCVEKRIPAIRDDNGEPIPGEWWVSDDYDEINSEYYPNLRDGACIAWMPLPEPYNAESEVKG